MTLDLNGRTLLVTGGTGSFGTAFTTRLLKEFPDVTLRIFSRDELKQSEMANRFDHDPRLRFFVGDIRSRERLSRATKGVDFIIHAAAMKQVPACEYNPFEAIQTNVLGSQHIVDAAIDNGVKTVVALSTDKAVNPVNLYGATKLCEEKLIVQGNAYASGTGAKLCCVRYGNVVGSRGSVLPLFRRLVAEGARTLPITDARMTRFWITLQQGVDFVLSGFARMQGGELFVPKLPSARTVDLAVAVAPELPHEIIGIRPGEKLHEVMCPRDDSRLTLEFADHFVIRPCISFNRPVDYRANPLGETGTEVADGFKYDSGSNPHVLDVPQLRRLIAEVA